MEKLTDRYPEQYSPDGQVADSQGILHTVYKVNYPTESYKGKVCALCGWWGPVEEFRKVSGEYYCVRNRCAEEKSHDRRRTHR